MGRVHGVSRRGSGAARNHASRLFALTPEAAQPVALSQDEGLRTVGSIDECRGLPVSGELAKLSR